MDVYDPPSGTWRLEKLKWPLHKTWDSSVVLLDGRIYVFGRRKTQPYTRRRLQVHAFDLRAKTWHNLQPVPAVRYDVSAIAMNGLLYVVGGLDARNRTLATVERYDPATDKWTACGAMRQPRAVAGIASLDGRLYVLGGDSMENGVLDSVEEYDPRTDVWRTMASMGMARICPEMVAHNGELYVFGGNSDNRTVEVFRAATNEWRLLATPMPYGSDFNVVCLIEKWLE